MCGFVGIIERDRRPVDPALLRAMADTIRHRGPDDDGYFTAPGIGLGFRRLSIIDLSGGHQPMTLDDGSAIVFNGEIYNYKALRAILEREGLTFNTTSDTEVLLKLFHSRGPSCLPMLEGMYGFCIYDARSREVHLVRDRPGKKPVYYTTLDGRLIFASEIKAILAALRSRPALNVQAVNHYLTLGFVPSPMTIWEGIHKLEPAHCLTYSMDRAALRTERYWEVTFDSQPLDAGRDYLKEFTRLFLDAVEKRLVASDVPVGMLLSGGIDSSAVSAAAVEMGHRNFHTFSVGFESGGYYSELDYARETARHIGSQHHEVIIGHREFLEFLPEQVWFTDEPLNEPPSVPLHYVCKLAAQHVKVVLSGEGSDEVLAGYDLERVAQRLDRLRVVDAIFPRPLIEIMARLSPPGVSATLGALAHGWSKYCRARRTHITDVWTDGQKLRLWRNRNGMPQTDDLIASWYDETRSEHPIDQLQQVYCRQWLVEDLLMKGDKISMANSLELRCPFLDHHLVEWAARLPLVWKVGDRRVGYRSKRILREFTVPRLPRVIIQRPKRGFPVPLSAWLRDGLGGWAEATLCGDGAACLEYFDRECMRAVLNEARRGDAKAAERIWNLIILELWFKRWL